MRTQQLFESFPQKVLLVGNGAIENKGELIDSYECVVRFNRFQIEGYEQHVGTKISAIGFAGNDLKVDRNKHLMSVYERYMDRVPLFCLSDRHDPYTEKLLRLEDRTRLLAAENHIRSDRPLALSTGVSTAVNLSLFFNKDVHLIGFDFMKTGHYWDIPHVHSPLHNGNFERTVVSNIKTITVL